MKPVILIAFIVSLVGTLALGARLVRAGLRQRGTPELVYGASLVLSGIGSIIRVIVFGVVGASEETRPAVVFASLFAVATLAVMTTGLRLIYRPGARWPFGLQGLLIGVGLCGTWSLATGPIGDGPRTVEQMLNDITNTSMMVWGAVEAFAYRSKLRRRAALGIAEPLVVERFGLWGSAFAVGALASLSIWLTPILTGVRILDAPAIAAAANVGIVAMTALTWMAFYPPTFLVRRVEGRRAVR